MGEKRGRGRGVTLVMVSGLIVYVTGEVWGRGEEWDLRLQVPFWPGLFDR